MIKKLKIKRSLYRNGCNWLNNWTKRSVEHEFFLFFCKQRINSREICVSRKGEMTTKVKNMIFNKMIIYTKDLLLFPIGTNSHLHSFLFFITYFYQIVLIYWTSTPCPIALPNKSRTISSHFALKQASLQGFSPQRNHLMSSKTWCHWLVRLQTFSVNCLKVVN